MVGLYYNKNKMGEEYLRLTIISQLTISTHAHEFVDLLVTQ